MEIKLLCIAVTKIVVSTAICELLMQAMQQMEYKKIIRVTGICLAGKEIAEFLKTWKA